MSYQIEIDDTELDILNAGLELLARSTTSLDQRAKIYRTRDHINREKSIRQDLMRASGFVTCPHCGADVEPKYIFICPRCKREGCPECIPTGKHTICPECEDKELK